MIKTRAQDFIKSCSRVAQLLLTSYTNREQEFEN